MEHRVSCELLSSFVKFARRYIFSPQSSLKPCLVPTRWRSYLVFKSSSLASRWSGSCILSLANAWAWLCSSSASLLSGGSWARALETASSWALASLASPGPRHEDRAASAPWTRPASSSREVVKDRTLCKRIIGISLIRQFHSSITFEYSKQERKL